MTSNWPRRRTPPKSVPVTTVPVPGSVKTRSTGSLGLPISRGGGVLGQHARERRLQVVEPSPGDHRGGNDGRVGEWAVLQPLTDCGDRTRFIRRQVGLGQRHHGPAHAEVGEDLEMLFRLRHPPIVSGDDQQGEVDRADAGDHVLDEVFVARNVDDPETKRGRRRRGRRKVQVGEAEVDRDPAQLLFRQTIRIGAGQRFDQRALAMIDMAGGGDECIVATAGHVDHGKSALIKALTGTDRIVCRKRSCAGSRSTSASPTWTFPRPRRPPSSFRLGIVDVPGHEDFVKNMVAGVGSIDLALLVVAADDGWMPQTEEHLQILTYFGVRRAVVALTKADLTAG